jgi:broad specificity phosphatase PhoE/nicotinamide riboside kinase
MVSHVVTHLHLLRHGRVDSGPRRIAYGASDLPLSAAGRAENEALVAYVADALPRPSGVLSSDLQRCLALAEPLASRLGVPLVVSPALREQDMGAWEGQAWDDLQAQHQVAINDYWDDYVGARPPGGESLRDVAERVGRWWEAEWPRLEGGRWMLAGHAGVIRSLLCRFLGLPLTEALRFAPAHGSCSHVLLAEAGTVLQSLGQLPVAAGAAEQYRSGAVARAGRRLALSGSAGTGKTTLGRRLAAELGVPFLEEGMRRRLEEGLQVHDLSRQQHRELIAELWEEQRTDEQRAEAEHGGFVADRSAVDFAAFCLLFHSHDAGFCARMVPELLAHAQGYDAVVNLPWGLLPLEADGVRSTNRWYQRHMQATVEGLVRRELPPGKAWFLPDLDDLDRRVRWVLDRVAE